MQIFCPSIRSYVPIWVLGFIFPHTLAPIFSAINIFSRVVSSGGGLAAYDFAGTSDHTFTPSVLSAGGDPVAHGLAGTSDHVHWMDREPSRHDLTRSHSRGLANCGRFTIVYYGHFGEPTSSAP